MVSMTITVDTRTTIARVFGCDLHHTGCAGGSPRWPLDAVGERIRTVEPMAATAPNRVRHVVLTGGPCAGKSSAMSALRAHLEDRGWTVLVAPEAATTVIAAGLGNPGDLAHTDRAAYLAAQHSIIDLQLTLRRNFDALAAALPGEKKVVLHDRGVADNAAYATAAEYDAVLTGHGLTAADALGLYDMVVHLRSASRTAAGYDGSAYTTANNAARSEDADAASQLDQATLEAWASHPHLVVIAPSADFTVKLARVNAAVLGALGDPEPLEHERKFLLDAAPDLTHPALAAAVVSDIVQVYLPSVDGAEHRVRARTHDGVTTYTHTTKKPLSGSTSRVEVERPIDQETFDLLVAMRDPDTQVVRKSRYAFVHADQRFELDHLYAPRAAWIVEAELVTETDEVTLPAFLGPGVDVTADPAWRNRTLAAAGAHAA